MNWNQHSNLVGKHALFSPSGYSWINYGTDQDSLNVIFQRYRAQYSTYIGTILHEYAQKRIKYRLRMHKSDKSNVLMYLLDAGIPMSVIDLENGFDNLMTYVNDAIGFRMDPEVILYYSDNCFGTADTIYFKDKELRIHDYKSGKIPAHIEQTEIYAGLFCLEYKIDPLDIKTTLRIYQNSDILEEEPEPERILAITKQIIELDKIVTKWKVEDKIS